MSAESRRFATACALLASVGIAACSAGGEPSDVQTPDAGARDVSVTSDAGIDVSDDVPNDADIDVDVSRDSRDPLDACGGPQEPCCGTQCEPFLVCTVFTDGPRCRPCESSRCFACGAVNQQCCMSDATCEAGLTCLPSGSVDICRDLRDAGCSRSGCFGFGAQFCGAIGDSCGGTVQCGPCTAPGYTCGGRGIPGVCGTDADSGTCEPVQCSTPAGRYCGAIGDGCGGALDCGECPEGTSCGAVLSNQCWPRSGCKRLECSSQSVSYCGRIGDGCGGELNCGCPGVQICGESIPNVCGTPCPTCSICDGGRTTTVSGVALTGAATNPDPVPRALVYVPRAGIGAGSLPPIAAGANCRACDRAPFDAVAWTVAGPDGRFKLDNVPAGTAIPIVVQKGGWRRFTTTTVAPCTDNDLPPGTVRLPRNQGEGDIPLTAIITGSDDPIECVLRKMGVDDGEFTNPDGQGRIHMYRGTGAILDARTPDAFGTADAGIGTWLLYAQLLLPCRGSEILASPTALANFTSYANRGGRVLATHFSYAWLAKNPPWSTIGTWTPEAANPTDPLTTDVTTTTNTNADFAAWLAATNALARLSPPQMSIRGAHADLRETRAGAELWLTSFVPSTTQLVTAPAPWEAPADPACGRVTFADFHVATTSSQDATFPSECGADLALSPEEKAIEYMIFDLASCPSEAPPPSVPPLPPLPTPPPTPRPPLPPPDAP